MWEVTTPGQGRGFKFNPLALGTSFLVCSRACTVLRRANGESCLLSVTIIMGNLRLSDDGVLGQVRVI